MLFHTHGLTNQDSWWEDGKTVSLTEHSFCKVSWHIKQWVSQTLFLNKSPDKSGREVERSVFSPRALTSQTMSMIGQSSLQEFWQIRQLVWPIQFSTKYPGKSDSGYNNKSDIFIFAHKNRNKAYTHLITITKRKLSFLCLSFVLGYCYKKVGP